jgi:hypothetical protein
LTLQQSSKHPALVSSLPQRYQVLNLQEGYQQMSHLIHSSASQYLKIAYYQAYLESALSGSMRNSDMINSDLFASDPSTFYIFFTLETKGMGGFSRIEGGKAAEDLENFIMVNVWIEILQQKCDLSALC